MDHHHVNEWRHQCDNSAARSLARRRKREVVRDVDRELMGLVFAILVIVAAFALWSFAEGWLVV